MQRDVSFDVVGTLRGLGVGSDGRPAWVAGQGPRPFQLEARQKSPRELTLEEDPGLQCVGLLPGPGAAWIAVLWLQGRMGVCEPFTGGRLAVFERASGVDGRLALSPDGRRLVATADFDELLVVDTERWRLLATLDVPGGGQPVLAPGLHPMGRIVRN